MEDTFPAIPEKRLRGGLMLYPSQTRAIAEVLDDLCNRLPAHRVLLIEVSGQVITTVGEMQGIDTVALGSLVAGDVAASHEIAHITGEYEEYQMILREGQRHHLFTMQVGTHLALLVEVSRDVPLGWARLTLGDSAHHLADLLAAPVPDAERELHVRQDHLPNTNALEDSWDKLWTEDTKDVR